MGSARRGAQLSAATAADPDTAALPDRLAAQLLSGPRPDRVLSVVRRLLAVQAQDPRGARLALRVRSSGTRASDVDDAFSRDRSLVISWCNRGTLHLVASEDFHWLHALTAPPQRTTNATRLAQEGVTPALADRAVVTIERALAEEGPLTRAQLRDHVAAAGVRTERQALVHLLFAATLRGLSVRGPMRGREQAFVLVRDWLGPEPARTARDVALAELARRYLAGHGPARDRDLAKWAGVPLRDARAGLSAIASQLHQREDGLVGLRAAASRPAAPVPPRLLGAFDPLLHGWVARALVTGSHDGRIVSGGLFRPFALVDGRAAALWRLVPGRPRVEIEALRALTGAEWQALRDDGEDVIRFLGL